MDRQLTAAERAARGKAVRKQVPLPVEARTGV
jgi:hypothetical protein